MAQLFKSGKRGTIAFDSWTLEVTGWTFTAEGKIEDTTNTGDYVVAEDRVYESHILTTLSGKGTCKAVWDFNDIPTGGGAPELAPGLECAVTLHLDENSYILCPKVTVTNLPIVSEVKGKISFDVEFTCNGPFTLPVS